jgi:hypothetical protein
VVFAAYCCHVKQKLKRECLAARRAFLFSPTPAPIISVPRAARMFMRMSITTDVPLGETDGRQRMRA